MVLTSTPPARVWRVTAVDEVWLRSVMTSPGVSSTMTRPLFCCVPALDPSGRSGHPGYDLDEGEVALGGRSGPREEEMRPSVRDREGPT